MISVLERIEEWKDQYHHYADDDLERQTHLYVVHKLILTSLHHQRIGWGREGRSKAHASSEGHGKEERVGTSVDTGSRCHGDGRHQYGGGGVADKHCQQ